MSLLPSVAIQWLLITSVLLFGSNVVLGVNAAPNATKVCCPPFDKRVELNGTVFCFATVSIPNDRATIGNYLCRNLNPHANLASFHSATEAAAVAPLGPAITGLVYEFDKFSWRDGTPVDFTQWTGVHPTINSSEAVVEVNVYGSFSTATLESTTIRKAFCKMEAEYTECPDCDFCFVGKTNKNSFCYRHVPIYLGFEEQVDAVENNICGKRYPGYEVATVHSKKENEFIRAHFSWTPNIVLLIALRIPKAKQSLPRTNDLFEWVDGSPVDYTEWEDVNSTLTPVFRPVNKYQRRGCSHTGYPTPYAWIMSYNGLWCTDSYWGLKYVICKKRVKCYMKW